MNTAKSITLILFAVIIAAGLMFAGCGSETAPGPGVESETATGPEGGPAPEAGTDAGDTAPAFNENFSADAVVTTMSGGSVITRIESTVYNGEYATRTETDMPMMGAGGDAPAISMIIIDRRDLGVSWQLFPKSGKYLEMEIVTDPAEGMLTMNMHDILYSEGYTLEEAGSETVNGYACDKYILHPATATLPDITIWSAKREGGVIVKTLVESPDGSSMTNELFNVEVGEPDASLFELPAGYTKATEEEIGMLMMQEMMGQ